MKPDKLYSYVILRLVPDAVTGEALNAGIVFHCAEDNFLLAKVRPSVTRMTHAFPGVSGNGLKRLLGWIEVSINKYAKRLQIRSRQLFEEEPRSAREFATLHFPQDDSLLQWSEERRGFTVEPRIEAERIFQRVIGFYDRQIEKGTRSDSDVWVHYLRYLEQVGVSGNLQEHTADGEIEPYVFHHALKNGRWHCLEPMSFDLMKAESIKSKARDKFAAMSFLEKSNPDLKVYFLLGEPDSDDGKEAAYTAIKILRRSPIESEVIHESAAFEFAERLTSAAGHHKLD